MDKNEVIAIVADKYCPMSDELKQAWAERSVLRKMKKGETLVRHHVCSDKVWFIASGSTIAHYTKKGRMICDWFTLDQEFICAITSYYSGEPSLHQIDLISDGILLETAKEDLVYLSDKFHQFERLARLSTTETMLRLQERVVSLQFESARERLDYLLRKYPNLYNQLSLGNIASYIGINQETLSRIRSNKKKLA